jgi:hypothetical protein
MSGSGRRGECLAAVVVIVADIDDACGRGKVDEGPVGVTGSHRQGYKQMVG